MKLKILVSTMFVVVNLAVSLAAGELTKDDILRGHAAGVSAETLVQLIETADVVVPLGTGDEAALLKAGVPGNVVKALQERAATPGPSTPSPMQDPGIPDDPRLSDIVRLVKSGLSESMIVQHINRSAIPFQPTVNDLIFLKNNNVPEPIIGALFGAETTTAIPATQPLAGTPTPSSPSQQGQHDSEIVTFSPLLHFTKMAGMIPRKTQGRLVLIGGRIEYVDEDKPDLSTSFFDSVLKKVYLECDQSADGGSVCFEIKLKTVHGDSYRFRDLDWKSGGNTQIMLMWNLFQERYPGAKFKKKGL